MSHLEPSEAVRSVIPTAAVMFRGREMEQLRLDGAREPGLRVTMLPIPTQKAMTSPAPSPVSAPWRTEEVKYVLSFYCWFNE